MPKADRTEKITYDDIMQARGLHYAKHLENHRLCMLSPAREHVLRIIPNLPIPRVDLWGDLDSLYLNADTLAQFFESKVYTVELQHMVSWYWSAEGWDDYCKQFQQLPEPFEEYTYRWQGGRLPVLVPSKFPASLKYNLEDLIPEKPKKTVKKVVSK